MEEHVVWTANADADDCGRCGKTFMPLIVRRHHCRFCGMVFCNFCSRHRIMDHRACEDCFLKHLLKDKDSPVNQIVHAHIATVRQDADVLTQKLKNQLTKMLELKEKAEKEVHELRRSLQHLTEEKETKVEKLLETRTVLEEAKKKADDKLMEMKKQAGEKLLEMKKQADKEIGVLMLENRKTNKEVAIVTLKRKKEKDAYKKEVEKLQVTITELKNEKERLEDELIKCQESITIQTTRITELEETITKHEAVQAAVAQESKKNVEENEDNGEEKEKERDPKSNSCFCDALVCPTRKADTSLDLGKSFMNNKTEEACFMACLSNDMSHFTDLVDLSTEYERHRRHSDHGTLMHIAASLGSSEMVRQLIDAGANMESLDCDGCTPIMVSSKAGRTSIVTQLIMNGANLDAQDEIGNTSLMYSITHKDMAIIDTLLKAQALVLEIKNKQGKHALDIAIETLNKNDQKMLKWMLQQYEYPKECTDLLLDIEIVV